MAARPTILLCCIFLSIFSQAQTYRTSRNALFDFLSSVPGVVQNIKIPRDEVLLHVPSADQSSHTGHLIRSSKGIYLTINGTGQVYHAEKAAGDSMSFTRVDSTLFQGYNNFSFEFLHRDTLFSLGGYGFWRINGHLRYFSKGREWSLASLDQEIPFNGHMAYYDSTRGSVFFVQGPYLNEATRTPHDSYSAGRIDLRDRSSRTLGVVEARSGIQPGRYLFSSVALGGMVVDDYRSIYLWDLATNRVWRLRNQALGDWIFGNTRNNAVILFETGGKLYQYDRLTDRLDSFPISRSDFAPTDKPVYKAAEAPGRIGYALGSTLGVLSIMILAFAAWRYRQRSQRNTTGTAPEPTLDVGPEHPGEDHAREETGFSELDLQLIDTVLKYSKEGKLCTVQEVNHVLGVGRKSLEIQKKMRRESFVRINRRFREMTGLEVDLIASRRSEEDKRYYQYFVPEEAFAAYARLRDAGNQG